MAFQTYLRNNAHDPLTLAQLNGWRDQLGKAQIAGNPTLARQFALLDAAVPQMTGEDCETVSWLLTVTVGDTNFEGRLDKCSLAAAQYALAAVLGRSTGNAGRIRKLEARIKKLTPKPTAETRASRSKRTTRRQA